MQKNCNCSETFYFRFADHDKQQRNLLHTGLTNFHSCLLMIWRWTKWMQHHRMSTPCKRIRKIIFEEQLSECEHTATNQSTQWWSPAITSTWAVSRVDMSLKERTTQGKRTNEPSGGKTSVNTPLTKSVYTKQARRSKSVYSAGSVLQY